MKLVDYENIGLPTYILAQQKVARGKEVIKLRLLHASVYSMKLISNEASFNNKHDGIGLPAQNRAHQKVATLLSVNFFNTKLPLSLKLSVDRSLPLKRSFSSCRDL